MFTKSNSTPKYNTFQNIGFMIRLAWNSDEKMVLVLCLLIALLSVAQNLINLYISPVILDAVENHGACHPAAFYYCRLCDCQHGRIRCADLRQAKFQSRAHQCPL